MSLWTDNKYVIQYMQLEWWCHWHPLESFCNEAAKGACTKREKQVSRGKVIVLQVANLELQHLAKEWALLNLHNLGVVGQHQCQQGESPATSCCPQKLSAEPQSASSTAIRLIHITDIWAHVNCRVLFKRLTNLQHTLPLVHIWSKFEIWYLGHLFTDCIFDEWRHHFP